MKLVKVSCALCNSSETEELFVGKDLLHGVAGQFPVVRCTTCRLVYVNPRPDAASLGDFYPDDYSPFDGGKGIVAKLKKALRRSSARQIARRLVPGAEVLEVGSAAGDLMDPLRDLGLTVSGIELSPYAVEVARQAGFNVHLGTLEDAPFPAQSFDAIVMRHVIEHVPSPASALDCARKLLKPGGLLFITTPNCNSFDARLFGQFWHAYDPPRHLTVFTVRTLEQLLKKSGFSLTTTIYSSIPNNWIYSLRNLLVEQFGDRSLWKFLSLANPLCLLFFTPLGLLQAATKKSGIVDVVAVREP